MEWRAAKEPSTSLVLVVEKLGNVKRIKIHVSCTHSKVMIHVSLESNTCILIQVFEKY